MYRTPEEQARLDAEAARRQAREDARDRERAAARRSRAAWWGRTTASAGRLISDNALVVALLGFGMYGSFGHVVKSATDHGQTRNMAVSIAVTIDLLAVVALAEYRRRRRNEEASRYPAGVAVFGIAVQLAANVSTAQRSAGGVFYAAWPALAFLLAAGLVETRPSGSHAKTQDETRARRKDRAQQTSTARVTVTTSPRRPELPTAPVAALDPAPVPVVVQRVPDEASRVVGSTIGGGSLVEVPEWLVEAAADPDWRATIKGPDGLMAKYGWTEKQANTRVRHARRIAADRRDAQSAGQATAADS